MRKKQLLIYYTVVIKKLLFPEVQQQKDGSSCGVYELAFAYTLAKGKDPSSFDFPDKAGLQGHLFQCII